MKFTTIFFDLDDTLYPTSTGLWGDIKSRIKSYMLDYMGFDEEEVQQVREKYFLQYGTTLRGLQAHHNINTDEYLAYVHDLPLKDYLTPDPLQRKIIASLPTRNLIFTNSDIHHAQRVLTALNLHDLFPTIVDVHVIAPHCKPMHESFEIAMKLAGETDPSRCVMIDDIKRTTRAAKELGMFSILYGDATPNGDADASISNWDELPQILENR